MSTPRNSVSSMPVPNLRLIARQKPLKMPLSRSSCISRATSQAAAVDTPIVTTGRQHTNHATESMAMSPMRFITVLYGLS